MKVLWRVLGKVPVIMLALMSKKTIKKEVIITRENKARIKMRRKLKLILMTT